MPVRLTFVTDLNRPTIRYTRFSYRFAPTMQYTSARELSPMRYFEGQCVSATEKKKETLGCEYRLVRQYSGQHLRDSPALKPDANDKNENRLRGSSRSNGHATPWRNRPSRFERKRQAFSLSYACWAFQIKRTSSFLSFEHFQVDVSLTKIYVVSITLEV